MDADFLDVKKDSKLPALIFFLIIIVLGVAGYFLVFKKTYFNTKTVEVELNGKLSTDVFDYVTGSSTNAKDYILDLKGIDTSTIGTYTYKVTYKKVTKKGKVEVADRTAPTFTLQTYRTEENDKNFFLGNVLSTCEDAFKPCIVTFKNKKDADKMNTPGEYELPIYVADIYGNKKEATANIIILKEGTLEDEKKNDLEYSHASTEIENFNNQYYQKLEKGMEPDTEETSGIVTTISAIPWDKYVELNYENCTFKDAQIIEIYNKSDYLIGIAIRLTVIENGQTKQIFATKPYVEENIENE